MAIANKAALAQMVKPGLLATVVPVLVGLIFKGIGTLRGDPLLGPKAVAGLLMFSTVVGVMMSLYMNNAGMVSPLLQSTVLWLVVATRWLLSLLGLRCSRVAWW